MNKGMHTYHGQEKDRQRWQASINRRNELIKAIKHNGIKLPEKPHEMKMKDLEKLLFG